MNRLLVRHPLTLILLALSYCAHAEVPAETAGRIDSRQAHFDYQLFCLGCHGPTGDGARGVPKIKGVIGTFLGSQSGREYLIKVPGAANAPLNDERLAQLMNWTIDQFAGDSKPTEWQAYNAAEIAEYRAEPLFEVEQYRKELLSQLTEDK